MDSRLEYERREVATRGSGDIAGLAHALRHLSELDRKTGDPRSAFSRAEEAVGLYRAMTPRPTLDLANALRLAALALDNLDGDATAAWREARTLYAEAGVAAGVEECDRRLDRS